MAASSVSGKETQKETERWAEICGDGDLESGLLLITSRLLLLIDFRLFKVRTTSVSAISSPVHNNKPPSLNLANIPPSPTFGSHWSFHNRNQTPDEGIQVDVLVLWPGLTMSINQFKPRIVALVTALQGTS